MPCLFLFHFWVFGAIVGDLSCYDLVSYVVCVCNRLELNEPLVGGGPESTLFLAVT